MSDTKIMALTPVSSLDTNDYFPIARSGANYRIKSTDVFGSNLVSSFMTRTGAITLTAADLNGLDGSGLTGIGTGTGGVINTGTTTIGGDSDADGVGTVAIQTRGLNRIVVANNGKVGFAGVTAPVGWLDVAPGDGDKVLRAARSTGSFAGFSFLQNQDASVGPFEWIVNSAVNPGGLRRDTYAQWGYNPRGETDDLRLYWGLETRWNPGGTQVQHEHYLEYISPSNGGGAVANARPFGFVIREDIQEVATTFFTSSLRVFDWPGHSGASHGYVEAAYPHLYIKDGYLQIDDAATAGAAEKRGIGIGGYAALEFDLSSSLYYLGDNGITSPRLVFPGNMLIGGNGDEPLATVQTFIKTRSNAIDHMLWLFNNNTADNYLVCQEPGGATHFKFTTAGVFQIWDGADLNVVSFGAADSGGAGYRVLRIPN